MGFKAVMEIDELWDGQMRSVRMGTKKILVAKYEGKYFAYADKCPHQGASLSDGIFERCFVTCAAHHWQFDVTTGCGVNPFGVELEGFPVKWDGDRIYVDVEVGNAP